MRGPIDWLEAAKLVRKCHPVKGRPSVPLGVQARENIFKLYLFDVGLLGHMLGLTYADQHAQDFAFKGYIAENFVQTELTGRVAYPTFAWEHAQAEVEFLHRARDGSVVPVEVKSGSRTRARSLRSYIARYEPRRAEPSSSSAVPAATAMARSRRGPSTTPIICATCSVDGRKSEPSSHSRPAKHGALIGERRSALRAVSATVCSGRLARSCDGGHDIDFGGNTQGHRMRSANAAGVSTGGRCGFHSIRSRSPETMNAA